MNKKTKILIIFLLIGAMGIFGWISWQKFIGQKPSVGEVPSAIPFPGVTGFLYPPSPSESKLEPLSGEKDPKEGSSGEVKLELSIKEDGPYLSWPKEYQLRTIKIYYLGFTENADDNVLIFKANSVLPTNFVPDKNFEGIKPPLLLGSSNPLLGVEVSLLPPDLFQQKTNTTYAVEAFFSKEGNGKLYQGIYKFTY